MHWCLNFVCATASGVLIRALEPTAGLDRMAERRGDAEIRRLCAGPGRLCQALGIDISFDGHALDQPPFFLRAADEAAPVSTGTRIGLSRGIDTPWRFALAGSRFLSRPMRLPSG